MADEKDTMISGLGFPNIGQEEPETDDAGAKTGAVAPNPEIEALRRQVEELTRASARSQDRLIAALAGREAPQQVEQPAFAPNIDIDLSDLPDINLDRAGFQKKLSEKIKNATVAASLQTVGAAQAQAGAEQARNAAFESLWDDFKDQYADLAPYDDIIENQAKRLIAKATARGVRADQYVLANRDQFLEDVAEATAARLDALGIAPGGDEGEAPPARRAAPRETNRTAGTFGGGRARVPARKEADAKPSSLATELKDIQRKLGYL